MPLENLFDKIKSLIALMEIINRIEGGPVYTEYTLKLYDVITGEPIDIIHRHSEN